MTIQYKRTYLAMQQVQHANQIYEFMPSSLPIHVFESILPAQCLYKTKAQLVCARDHEVSAIQYECLSPKKYVFVIREI